MEKQLQFIKYKASFALSLFLLLINQITAQADISSDKTKWLTNNLDKTESSSNARPLITLKALSAKRDNAQPENSIIVSCSDDPRHTIKLRPFMANRKLPSRRDLELTLIEQKAKLADENNARLSGKISAFATDNDNINKPNSIANKISHPWQSPIQYNRQLANKSSRPAFSLMRQAEQHLLSSNRPQLPQANSTNNSVSNNQTAISSITVPSNKSIALTTNQSNQLASTNSTNVFNEESGPSAFSLPAPMPMPSNQNQLTSSGFGTAGPPPFPLNLLPEASLKQLVRTLAVHKTSSNTQKVAFGSWHTAYTLNSMSGSHIANLPYAGFQSHLAHPNTRTFRKTNSNHISALPVVTGSPTKSGSNKQKTQNSNSKKDTSARNRMLLESQVRVAAYPPYNTQSLKLWNFAE